MSFIDNKKRGYILSNIDILNDYNIYAITLIIKLRLNLLLSANKSSLKLNNIYLEANLKTIYVINIDIIFSYNLLY